MQLARGCSRSTRPNERTSGHRSGCRQTQKAGEATDSGDEEVRAQGPGSGDLKHALPCWQYLCSFCNTKGSINLPMTSVSINVTLTVRP